MGKTWRRESRGAREAREARRHPGPGRMITTLLAHVQRGYSSISSLFLRTDSAIIVKIGSTPPEIASFSVQSWGLRSKWLESPFSWRRMGQVQPGLTLPFFNIVASTTGLHYHFLPLPYTPLVHESYSRWQLPPEKNSTKLQCTTSQPNSVPRGDEMDYQCSQINAQYMCL